MKERTIDLESGVRLLIQESRTHVDVFVHRIEKDKVLLPRAYSPGSNSLRFFLPGCAVDEQTPPAPKKEIGRARKT